MANNHLISAMAQTMFLHKEGYEDEKSFSERVLYSAGSAWFRTLIFEDGGNPSITLIKRRLHSKLKYFTELCPYLRTINDDFLEIFVDKILETHQLMGTVYHSQQHLTPAIERECVFNGIRIFRCGMPDEDYSYSGLGIFRADSGKDTQQTPMSIFGLTEETTYEIVQARLAGRTWQPLYDSEGLLYLNVNRKPFQKYYSEYRPDISTFILAYRMNEGRRSYLLIRGNECSALADWETLAGIHRYLTLFLFQQCRKLVAITQNGEYTTSIAIDIYLPHDDELLFRYFAWPQNFSRNIEDNDTFNFIVDKRVFPVFAFRLNALGFCVEEKNNE